MAAPEQSTVKAAIARQDAVQALLGVLNDIGGGNPWNYNVLTEAAEDALSAALPHIAREFAAEIVERYCDTSQGIVCSDFRKAADFILERYR